MGIKDLFTKNSGGIVPIKKAEKFQEDVLEKISDLLSDIDDLIDEEGIPMSAWEDVQKHSSVATSELRKIIALMK